MSTHSIDPESFQALLANAFEVQESGVDLRSLSALVEVQRSMAMGEPDENRALHLIADCVRSVAHASGIAIALLEADRLIYRAASGTAGPEVGRCVTAVLNVSQRDQARREILRVENARTGAGIGAELCRQFGAGSLLILPVCREHGVAGVLEVRFHEAHTFDDREVRTYRLMAGLVEELMFPDIRRGARKPPVAYPTTVPTAIRQITSQMPEFYSGDRARREDERRPRIGQISESTVPETVDVRRRCLPTKPVTSATRPVKHPFLEKLRRNVGVAAVGAALVSACWIAYDQHLGSLRQRLPLPRSNSLQRQAPAVLENPGPVNPSSPQAAKAQPRGVKTVTSQFKRVRIGSNEVDEVAEDVTIRRFTLKSPPQVLANQQVSIGEDVTVRYFASTPAVVSPKLPISQAPPPKSNSSPVSK